MLHKIQKLIKNNAGSGLNEILTEMRKSGLEVELKTGLLRIKKSQVPDFSISIKKQLGSGDLLIEHQWLEIGDYLYDPLREALFSEVSLINVFITSDSRYIQGL